MNEDFQKKLSSLHNCIGIQRQSLAQGYMLGMLNGLIMAESIFTDARPKFADHPRKTCKNNVRHKSRKRQ